MAEIRNVYRVLDLYDKETKWGTRMAGIIISKCLFGRRRELNSSGLEVGSNWGLLVITTTLRFQKEQIVSWTS
jgi:hypothetical protein